MKKWLALLKSRLLGGFLLVLPLLITLAIVNWLVQWVNGYLNAFAVNLAAVAPIPYFLSYGIATAIAITALVMGSTRVGKALYEFFEIALARLPFYVTIRDTIKSLLGKEHAGYHSVVLMNAFGSEVIGFITAEYDGLVSIFVPSSPSPTNGYTFHRVDRDQYICLPISPEEGMRLVISCGVGAERMNFC